MTKYHITPEGEASARQITEEIRKAADNLWELLLEAWNMKAYASLGYRTWSAYVDAEFDFSQRHAYRLVNQGSVVKQLREAVTEITGVTDVSHPEAISFRDVAAISVQSSDLEEAAQVRPEVIEAVKEQVAAGVPAQEAVKSAVSTARTPITRAPLVTEDADFEDDVPEVCEHEYVCVHCGEPQ